MNLKLFPAFSHASHYKNKSGILTYDLQYEVSYTK